MRRFIFRLFNAFRPQMAEDDLAREIDVHLALLEDVAGLIAGKTLCAFGDAAATPALTTLKHFRGEYEAHVREGRCTVPAPWRRRHAVPASSH